MPIDVRVVNESGWRSYEVASEVNEPLFVVGATEPTSSNTGPRVVPTNTVVGDVTLTTGQTYSGRIVQGRITIPVSATGTIIIEDNIIDATQISATSGPIISVHVNTGATVIIRFNEIKGHVGLLGIGYRRYTAYRNWIHHVEDGFRCHNYNGTGVTAATTIEANCIEDLIVWSPDPNQARADNRTHSDCIQIEGGDGIVIRGNSLNSYHSGSPTSNQEWAMSDYPYESVPTGTAGARAHPQGCQVIMLSPNVSAITNLTIDQNWCRGGEFGINGGPDANSAASGVISDNRFDRGQWHPTFTINLDAGATNLVTSGNVYEDDNSAVTVRRNG